MDQEDLEKRVAELERQLAEQKGIAKKGAAGQDHAVALPHPSAYAQAGARRVGRRTTGVWSASGVVALILVIGFSFIVAAVLTYAVPSSAQWASGMMCSSPYRLQGSDVQTSGVYGGQTSGTFSFTCVSGDSSYDVNSFPVIALQTLPVALVLCGVIVGVRMWRRLRGRPR